MFAFWDISNDREFDLAVCKSFIRGSRMPFSPWTRLPTVADVEEEEEESMDFDGVNFIGDLLVIKSNHFIKIVEPRPPPHEVAVFIPTGDTVELTSRKPAIDISRGLIASGSKDGKIHVWKIPEEPSYEPVESTMIESGLTGEIIECQIFDQNLFIITMKGESKWIKI